MAVTRAWTASQIGTRLGDLLSGVGIAAADTAGNLKEPLDDTWRMLGVVEESLATEELSTDTTSLTLALARLNTLKAIRDRLAVRFDLSTPRASLRLQQTVATVERMIVEAMADVAAAQADAAGVFDIDMNYLDAGTMGVVSRDWPYTTIGVGDG